VFSKDRGYTEENLGEMGAAEFVVILETGT
jgi:hypothetical protein